MAERPKGDDMKKLESTHLHIMRLIKRDSDADGWSVVSNQLFKVLSENIPTELAVFKKTENAGRAKLTEEGESVLRAAEWL